MASQSQTVGENNAENNAETTDNPDTPENPEISEESDISSEIRGKAEAIAKRRGIDPKIVSERLDEMKNDTRAQSGQGMMDKGVDLAVGILVVGLLTAYLLPIALEELNSVDTSSWGSAESELFGLLGLFFVLAILLFVVNKAKNA